MGRARPLRADSSRLGAAVEDLRGSGLLKRLGRGSELQLGRQTIDVLETILGGERAIIDIAVFAARLCGDAKALNDGRPLATVVLRAHSPSATNADAWRGRTARSMGAFRRRLRPALLARPLLNLPVA